MSPASSRGRGRGRGRPRGRKGSNIGRRDRNRRDAYNRNVRANETAEERASRLESDRLQTSQARDNETVEERASRVEANRLQMSQARANETAEERASRLESDRRAHIVWRDSLPEQQRELIREADRIRHSQSWEGMSEHERNIILEVRRISQQQNRANLDGLDLLIVREGERIRQDRHRAGLDPFQRLIIQEADRLAHARLRQQMDEQERETARARNAELMANVRAEFAQRGSFAARTGDMPGSFVLGARNQLCQYGCNALRFPGTELRLGRCCNKGATRLEESQRFKTYPEDMKLLLIGQHANSRNFFEYIRRYNSAFSFASLGSKAVTPPGHGPYCYKIHGQIYHRSGLLHTEPNEAPKYAQIYILEGDGALDARLNNNSNCLRDVMFLIQRTLEACNPYVAAYKNLHTIEQDEMSVAGDEGREAHTVRMVFHAGPDSRRYNAPVHSDDVAAVFVGNEGMPGQGELCVYPKATDALSKIPGRLFRLSSTNFFRNPINGMTTADLQALNPEGFPIHDLCLKQNCTVRLLKSLASHPDIKVGDRLIVTELENHWRGYIKCKFNNREIAIGQADFVTSHLGNEFIRKQFPLKLERNLEIISPLNKNLDPMIYPILFPSGEHGWHTEMRKHNRPNAKHPRISQLQYYSHRFAYRQEPFSPIHYSRKLFQQYAVDCYVRVESNNLNYVRTHQPKLRVHKYSTLREQNENENVDPGARPPGKPVILPSSFVSGPRYMKQNYQDAMAMVTKFGKPSLFITFTCNPKHKDIVENLGNLADWPSPPLTASDRPDIVASVFKYHLDELKLDVKRSLGTHLADIHVIEYQKRGLPHAHILVWLNAESQLRTPDEIDSLICAEIPDPEQNPDLYGIVTTQQMHGPCGVNNPRAPCMVDGKCSKQFPKQFQDVTQVGNDGYPLYRRVNNGRVVEKNGVALDNRSVVPYSPWLSAKFNAHINVEACTSIKSVKYIFKYVYKGYDCANIERVQINPETHDEIKTYLDARYVSAPEAMWRMNEFEVCYKSHSVVRLDVHLKEGSNVTFREDEEISEVINKGEKSKLTEYFELNKKDREARQYLYADIPLHYTWHPKKEWKRRVQRTSNIIARMYAVSPKNRETFYLRMLLLHVRGARSYEELRTFEDVEHETYESACRARGLLIDDTEWDRTLSEASATASARQLRDLFVTILGCCEPSNPIQLWTDYKTDMSEDFVHNHDLDSIMAEQYALQEINSSLRHNFGISITSFGFSLAENLPDLNNEGDQINPEVESAEFSNLHNQCNAEQRLIVDSIVHEIDSFGANSCFDRPRVFFIDAPGGCGKTFVANTLISYTLSRSLKVASCAWTGIAGNLLRFGKTLHCLFKLPLNITETSTCNVATGSQQAQYLKSLSLIFIDEASMIPLNALHAIERMLRDITGSNAPFGGKLLVFAGDFRQTLPIIPRAKPAAILENCINRSNLWQHFRKFELTENMRANANERAFCDWLIDLGDNRLQSSHTDTVPGQFDIPSSCNLTNSIVNSMYPDFSSDKSKHIILTPKNIDTHEINRDVLAKFKPAVSSRSYFSTDCIVEDEGNEVNNFSVEFLHSLTPSGMPLHELELKVGCPVMLLRNMDTKNGLCNGTRLTVTDLGTRFIEAEIISGSSTFIGRRVYIPRIKLVPSDATIPFKFQRTQFPVRLAYCMTINKSQGQTFDKVGIYLPLPCFSHGQAYVAFSRARCFEDITVHVKNTSQQFVTENLTDAITMNIVFDVGV